MLQQVLKEATKTNHDELEQLMFVNEIMNRTLSVQQYRQILATNYIVHACFEDQLFNNLSAEIAGQLNIARRRKLPALAADMHEAGLQLPDIPATSISFKKTDAAVLGAMYVMEGATLGGSIIAKQLQANPIINNSGLSFNYYQVYGNNLIPYWKTFCLILNRQHKSVYDEVLSSAMTMFKAIAHVQQENNKLMV